MTTIEGKAIAVRHERIDEAAAGQRIDNYLMRIAKGVPKSHVYRILRSGEVRVNGGRVQQTYRLNEGDEVRIPPIRVAEPARSAPAPVGKALPVVYEDDALLVIDKPSGKAVHGGSGVSYGVIEQLRRARPEARFLELVHRLDKETSGVMCFARTKTSERALHEVFKRHQAQREYVAVVQGVIGTQTIESELVRDRGDGLRGSARDDTRGGHRQRAVTHIVHAEPLRGRHGMMTRVRLRLETGRTHQIRIHLAEAGHPVVGEAVYIRDLRAEGRTPIPCARLLLHAETLAFTHPLTGEALSYVAEPPPSFVSALAELLPPT